MTRYAIVRFLSAALRCALIVLPGPGFTPARSETAGFVRVSGRSLTLDGELFQIKGIAMGNGVWSNPASAPVRDHDGESFRELAELGFNSVRFYLNYALFESDPEPYTYREEGFEWLDRNIAWAKEHGIRLILNMHYPQGGYQSQGNGDRLWTDRSCQERLIALWSRIAERYRDETAIIGYGLVNEPMPVGKTNARDGLRVWRELAQEIADSIRRSDPNHVLFVERVLGVKDPKTGATDWSLPPIEQFVTIRDDNTAYEFHTYDPHSFTHQGFDWAGTGGTQAVYPDDSLYASGLSWLSFQAAPRAKTGSTDWQYLESGLLRVTDPKANALALCFQASAVGRSASAYADDLYIDVYDENGQLLQSVPCETSETHGTFSFWSQNGSGQGLISQTQGVDDRRSLRIRGTTGDANMTLVRLAHESGRQYRVRGYVKADKAAASALITLRLDAYHADAIRAGSREMLLQSFRDALLFSETSGCPVYCGEFGAGIHCFQKNRGGEAWVTDSIAFLLESGIGFNYHAYYDGSFGLYYDAGGKRVRNEALFQVLRDCLRDSGTSGPA